MGDESKKTFHPIAQDGTILEEITFEVRAPIDLESKIIAGKPYFLKRNGRCWIIYTAEKKVVGKPLGYLGKPFLCERDGQLTFVAKDLGEDTWWIYDAEGKPIKKICEDGTVTHVATVDGHYFFVVSKTDSQEVLLNEQGSVLWENNGRQKIEQFSSKGSTLTFLTRQFFADDDVEEDIYYDQQGKEIANYPAHAPKQPPIAVGGSYAYAYCESDKGQLTIRYYPFPTIVLGRFEKIYAMEPIDADRFYVIGLEKKDDNSYQIAKRVYDVRNLKN